MNLEQLAKQISLCSRCPLRENAQQPVPGLGEVGAKYFLIGEAPGKNEDKQGMPFVGSSGKRLNKLLALAGIDENECYFSNVCRCWPPKVKGKQRQPKKAERLACYPWLKAELSIVKPKVIVPLGAVPLSLFTDVGITQLHGTQFEYELELDEGAMKHKVTIMPMYHPAAALHRPRLYAIMLDDWENKPEQVDHDFTVYELTDKVLSYDQTLALDTENDPSGGLGEWSVAWRHPGSGVLTVNPYYGSKPFITFNGDVVFHHAKHDLRVLDRAKMKRPKPEQVHDTMIQAYCLGLGRQDTKDTGKSGTKMVGGLGLKYLARRHLGMEMKTWQEVEKSTPEEIAEYNANDSVATYLLDERWRPKLPQHYYDIDMPLLDVLMTMEDRGVMVDPAFLKRYAEYLDEELEAIKVDLPLNPYAPKQVGDYIYGTLGIEPTKFTETGQPSTDKEILETIDDPIVRQILKYKEFYIDRKTYVSNYVDMMDINNRIHCEFKQTSTATGRLSSARPNLQNVTKDKEDRPSKLRELFIAPGGMSIVRVDWWQLELLVMAALSQDPNMLKALKEGRKLHQEVADRMGVSYDDAKIMNFQIQYGGTPFGLSQTFHIPVFKAKQLRQDYFDAFPGVGKFVADRIEQAHEEKAVYTYFGRRRRLDAMFSEHFKTIREGEREAVNTPIQGTGGEIVKRAMVDLHLKHRAPMTLQVHDEILFEVPDKEAVEYGQWLKEYLPTLTEVNGVRFPVSVGVGKTWTEAMKNG